MGKKQAKPTRGTAKCADCMFGREVEITDDGKDAAVRHVCECHLARPTSSRGWPCVRPDDWCSHHVDAVTAERTFAGLVAAVPAPF